MKDLKADWRRWIPAERIAAVCIALGMTSGSQRCFFSAEDDFGQLVTCNRFAHLPWRGLSKMDIVIGPVLTRPGGYGFDVWTVNNGVRRGYPYRRIEDACYARNAEIRASAQGRAPAAIVCQTLDEFIVKSTGCETLAAA
jgi:hypothetical protein